MHGCFRHGSVRNACWEICDRLLAGASGACVILSVLAAFKVNARAARPEQASFCAC